MSDTYIILDEAVTALKAEMKVWDAGVICDEDGGFTFDQAEVARSANYFSICALVTAVNILTTLLSYSPDDIAERTTAQMED